MASLYSSKAIVRAIIIATTFAGTLDILSAFAYDIYDGGEPLAVLRGIGSAILDRNLFANPFILPGIGLALHFAIMLVMATVYLVFASRLKFLTRWAKIFGFFYGLALWGVMYWVVLPHRWPTLFPVLSPVRDVAEQVFSHVFLVGIPIALVARSATRWRYTSDEYY